MKPLDQFTEFAQNKSNRPLCSVENKLLKISQNSQENTYVRASFLIKLQALGLQLY